tara:strand:- start:3797 stop:4255 length:459 start_codon:yes stop_codon:yes gene_type:complete
MARMHNKGKGQSGSTKPVLDAPPGWSETDKDNVESLILKYANEGKTTSEIGIILRDQHAVPNVKLATGERITSIIEKNGTRSKYPEDMMNLMRQAQRIIDHLESGNQKDIHNRRQLELTESRLRRLSSYYRNSGRIPSDWTYKRDQLRLMIQ